MNFQHKELAAGRWNKLTFLEQMANIGSEVERAIKWRQKNNNEYCRLAVERALELLSLTLADKKNELRLKELCRVQESLVDFFIYNNVYQSSAELWHKYFFAFNYAAKNPLAVV
ncbi:MAG: hypothetical protein ABIE84_06385 [bacterium]